MEGDCPRFLQQQALVAKGLFRLSSSGEFAFPRLSCESLERGPALLRGGQHRTSLKFVRQISIFF